MYTDLITILGLSFLLGIRHATDADHVVAVTTIVARQKKGIFSSALVGILWGIGHSITVTLVGIPIIMSVFVLPPRLGLFLEFIVGLMLIILGILNLFGIASKITKKFTPLTIHKHPHSDSATKHSHLHLSSELKDSFHHLGIFQTIRPIIVGFVHGLAGSTAIALLILSTIRNTNLAVFYLLIFHIGVISGMMIITMGIGASITLARKKGADLNHHLVPLSGILSLIFGLYVVYQTGIVSGLFSGLINWTPK